MGGRVGLLAASAILWLALAAPRAAGQDLDVVLLDVGQGDCVFLRSPTGVTMLIDSGNNGDGNAVVRPFLNAQGVSQLDYFVASHYHADHIGGIDEVIGGGIGVTVSYDRGGSYGTATYDDYVAAVGGARTTIAAGQVIDLGGGVTATCVAVNGAIIGGAQVPVQGTSQEENAVSVALLIAYGDFRLFSAGDLTGGGFSTADVESVVAPQVGDVDVLKACHHGSNTSNNQTLLSTTLPEIALISCGDGNPFGHPHVEVIDRLTNLSSMQAIYQTEAGTGGTSPLVVVVNDHIPVVTDGITYTVNGNPVDPPIDPPPGADLVITEIMKNPAAVPDSAGEYLEIYNRGTESVDLAGWVLYDDDFDMHQIAAPGGLVIDPGEYLLLGRNGSPAQNGGFLPDYVFSGFILGNGADEVVLGPAVGTEEARVNYDDISYPDTPGISMELTDLDAPNSGPAYWAEAVTPFGAGDLGTPGAVNGSGNPPDPTFLRGDANADGVLNISDPIRILDLLFGSGLSLDCADAGDANDDGAVDIADVLYDLGAIFEGGFLPPPPFPIPGPDPTPDPLGC
ncbi:MAG: lamin tail domain-containing protein [Planctomycetota bacterium]